MQFHRLCVSKDTYLLGKIKEGSGWMKDSFLSIIKSLQNIQICSCGTSNIRLDLLNKQISSGSDND